MIKEKILDIIDEIGAEHPYKISGVTETYSQYNEAWADCCDKISRKIEEYFDTTNKHQQKYLVSYFCTNPYRDHGCFQTVVTMDFEDEFTENNVDNIMKSLKKRHPSNYIAILNIIKLDN